MSTVDGKFSGTNLEEYQRLLYELDRIREKRRTVPYMSSRAIWEHKDIDTLIRIIQVQAAVMQTMRKIQAQIIEQNRQIVEQEKAIQNLARRIEEECKP